jgi:hypothetical protein
MTDSAVGGFSGRMKSISSPPFSFLVSEVGEASGGACDLVQPAFLGSVAHSLSGLLNFRCSLAEFVGPCHTPLQTTGKWDKLT